MGPAQKRYCRALALEPGCALFPWFYSADAPTDFGKSLCKCPSFPHVQHLAGFLCPLLGLFGFVREDTKDWSSFTIVSSFFSK